MSLSPLVLIFRGSPGFAPAPCWSRACIPTAEPCLLPVPRPVSSSRPLPPQDSPPPAGPQPCPLSQQLQHLLSRVILSLLCPSGFACPGSSAPHPRETAPQSLMRRSLASPWGGGVGRRSDKPGLWAWGPARWDCARRGNRNGTLKDSGPQPWGRLRLWKPPAPGPRPRCWNVAQRSGGTARRRELVVRGVSWGVLTAGAPPTLLRLLTNDHHMTRSEGPLAASWALILLTPITLVRHVLYCGPRQAPHQKVGRLSARASALPHRTRCK